jgi:hypothetical protein
MECGYLYSTVQFIFSQTIPSIFTLGKPTSTRHEGERFGTTNIQNVGTNRHLWCIVFLPCWYDHMLHRGIACQPLSAADNIDLASASASISDGRYTT